MIKSIIIDDHPVIRAGFNQVLTKLGFSRMLEADSVASAKNELNAHDWSEDDLCILDLSLPDGDGVELLRYIRRNGLPVPILIHSANISNDSHLRYIQEGASGSLPKSSTMADIAQAVTCVRSGNIYMPPKLTSELITSVSKGAPVSKHHKLSSRELEVLALIGSGKTISTIAEKLLLNVNTVSTYKSRIMQKLEVDNMLELIRYALHHNLKA